MAETLQNEDRTLWEATNVYVEMSPFMSANKIKKPILLIHGEEDNNPGTITMQVIITSNRNHRKGLDSTPIFFALVLSNYFSFRMLCITV